MTLADTVYTTVCGHPLKLVDSAISATPVADRCITLSTQPCKLQRQELSDIQRGTVIEWHRSNKSVGQISALLELPRSTFKCRYCEVETSSSNNSAAAKW